MMFAESSLKGSGIQQLRIYPDRVDEMKKILDQAKQHMESSGHINVFFRREFTMINLGASLHGEKWECDDCKAEDEN